MHHTGTVPSHRPCCSSSQVLKKIAKYIQEQNEKIYAPRGLLITDPIERGMRVVSFVYDDFFQFSYHPWQEQTTKLVFKVCIKLAWHFLPTWCTTLVWHVSLAQLPSDRDFHLWGPRLQWLQLRQQLSVWQHCSVTSIFSSTNSAPAGELSGRLHAAPLFQHPAPTRCIYTGNSNSSTEAPWCVNTC